MSVTDTEAPVTIPAEVLLAALQLDARQREALAMKLILSLDDGPADPGRDQAWADEIARRVQAMEAGEAKLIPWEEVRARLKTPPAALTRWFTKSSEKVSS